MPLHTIEPNDDTLHGFFSADLPPVLTIDHGDTVRFRTLDAGWGLEPPPAPGVPRRQVVPRIEGPPGPPGHALCGPVALRGAQPGMTLAVRIDAVQPGTWGATYVRGEPVIHVWTLDVQAGRGRNQYGHSVTLSPFMGVMGLAPAEPGKHSTIPPRACGGNIDCKELVVGSTLYLPIEVPGALFSVGDGHALQADGEVSGTAIECPMDRVDLTFMLEPNMHLTTPRAHTPAGWITFGFHEDLNQATQIALQSMLQLMREQYALQRGDALALASLVVDLRVTQIVNQVCGVHAVLPHGALQQIDPAA